MLKSALLFISLLFIHLTVNAAPTGRLALELSVNQTPHLQYYLSEYPLIKGKQYTVFYDLYKDNKIISANSILLTDEERLVLDEYGDKIVVTSINLGDNQNIPLTVLQDACSALFPEREETYISILKISVKISADNNKIEALCSPYIALLKDEGKR